MGSPLWDFVDALSETKRDLLATGEATIGSYEPFMVTRAFSRHADCVLAAGEINQYSVDPVMHHDYWMGAVRPRRRRGGKWESPRDDHEVSVIMELYGCNRTRATELAWVIGPAETARLVEKYEDELGTARR